MGRRSATACSQSAKRKTRLEPSGLKPWSCTATATASKRGSTPSSAQGLARAPPRPGRRSATSAAAPAGRRRSTSSAAPSPTTRAPSARTLSRSSAKVAAAASVATKAWPAARCAFIAAVDGAAAHDRPAEDHGLAARPSRRRSARADDLRARGHDELDGVLERLAGAREEDVGWCRRRRRRRGRRRAAPAERRGRASGVGGARAALSPAAASARG